MHRIMGAAAFAGLAFAVFTTAAHAQTQGDDDWDYSTDPSRRLTMASASFDSGTAVAVRCTDGALDVLVTGLPPAAGMTRTLLVGRVGEAQERESWTVGSSATVAFSQVPARFARALRGGGRLEVVAQDETGQPDRRLVYDLPTEWANIDRTLQACDRPLQDERDALGGWVIPASATNVWSTPPRPQYSKQALDAGVARGFAVLSCVVRPRGVVRDCRVESESPTGYRLGRSAVTAVHNARLNYDRADPEAGAGSTFVMRFDFWIDDRLMGGDQASRLDRNYDGTARNPGNDDNENPPLPNRPR